MDKKVKSRIAFISAFIVVMIWGETYVSSKVLLDHGMEPAEIFLCRFLLAYLCIVPFAPKRLWAQSARDEFRMMLLGLTGGTLYFLTENTALKFSTASNVAIILCSVPFVTALMMAAFYRDERMTRRQVLGSLVAVAGMVMVVLNGEFVLRLNPLGDLLAFCSVVVWASYSVVMKRVSGRYSPLFISRKLFAYGIISIAPYFIINPLSDRTVFSEPVVWGNLLYLGIVASMLCFVLWNWSLATVGTVKTTNLLYTQPFFTMLIACIVLGDRITVMAVIGTVLLTVGTMYTERR